VSLSFRSIAAWLRSRKVELGLGVRVTVAAMGALAIALALGLKLPLWAVLTSLIVTQMSVGRSLKATRDYLVGTLGGALTGLAVSFLVLPSRAHNQIRATAARVLELMASALGELLSGLTRGRDADALHRLQDGIGTALVGLNATGAEAERERAARLSAAPDTGPLLRTTLRLRHDLVMIGRASVVPLPAELQLRLSAPLARVADAIAGYLRASAAALRSKMLPPAILPVQSALQAYAAEVAAVRSDGLTRGVPGDVAERFFALGFSLEQMRQNLKDLERCVAVWADASDVPARKLEDEVE
jgi:uncharacterized membrane protein YccC